MLDGANVIAEKIGNDSAYYSRGLSLISRKADGSTDNYYTDYHGSVIRCGNVTYQYDAFGNELSEKNDTNPFRYCGEYWDSETNLIYLRNRYYDVSIGAFTQEDPAKDGLNWYIYCENNPVNFVDPFGEDAIVLTNRDTVGWDVVYTFGHTSALYQNANGQWFYTYWGDKAAAVIAIPTSYFNAGGNDIMSMSSLQAFNGALNKFLSDNKYENITPNYTDATYVVGDFTASLSQAYDDVNNAYYSSNNGRNALYEHGGSRVFQGENGSYSLNTDNCLDRTYESLSKGTLINGMNAGEYMRKRGFNGGLIPNNAINRFSEVFINSSFTRKGAYNRALEYATLYIQGSSWAQIWEKANYANKVVGW